jgi:hypothetical protein
MLLSRPVLLDHAAAMDAWLRLDTQLRGAQLPLDRTVARPRVADALRAGAFRPRARRPRKKRPSLISALLGVMLLFGFAVVGPDLARNVGDVVADYMTRDLPEPQACGAPDVDRPGADRGDADRPKDDKRQRQGGKRQAKGDC